MRLIVHFGTPKTGTSALQETLLRHRRKLLGRGILYPRIAQQRRHHILTGMFVSADKIHSGLLDRFGSEKEVRRAAEVAWKAVLEQIRRHKPGTVILSSEMFVFGSRQEELERLRDRLLEVTPTITAVLYVRSPAHYYLSGLQQNVRTGRLLPPHAFEFRSHIESIERVFGGDIIVRCFERHRLSGGDIVSDFFSAVLMDRSAAIGLETVTFNESISAEAMSIILQHRRICLPDREGISHSSSSLLRHKLVQIERARGGVSRPRLRPEVDDAIVRASDDLLWLQQEYGIAFADVDYAKVGTGGLGEIGCRGTVESICELDEARRADLLYAVLGEILEPLSQLHDVQRLLPARQGLFLAGKGARVLFAGAKSLRNVISR